MPGRSDGCHHCAAIAFFADPEKPLPTLIQAGAAIVGIVFLLWILRERPPENHAKMVWSWLGRPRKRTVAFRAQAKLPPSQRTAAPPAPPTAETIRALTGGTSTWVPSANAPPGDAVAARKPRQGRHNLASGASHWNAVNDVKSPGGATYECRIDDKFASGSSVSEYCSCLSQACETYVAPPGLLAFFVIPVAGTDR